MRRYGLALGLGGLAVLSVVALAVAHELGWRADTSVIAGGVASTDAELHGVLYVVLWLQAWVLAPVVALAAAALAVWEAVAPSAGPVSPPAASPRGGRAPSAPP